MKYFKIRFKVRKETFEIVNIPFEMLEYSKKMVKAMRGHPRQSTQYFCLGEFYRKSSCSTCPLDLLGHEACVSSFPCNYTRKSVKILTMNNREIK